MIDGGGVVPEVVVVSAFNLPVDLRSLGSVDGAHKADGVTGVAGAEGKELGEVATVEGDGFNGGGIENGVLGSGCGIDGEGVGGDDYGRLRRGDLKLEGQAVDCAGIDGNVLGDEVAEAIFVSRDFVDADGEIGECEVAGAGRDSAVFKASRGAAGGDGGRGKQSAGWIDDGSVDGSAKSLRASTDC